MEHFAAIMGASMQRAPWGWGLFVMIAIALIKSWPAISLAATKAFEARVSAKRMRDENGMERLTALESKVESYQNRVIQLERQSNTALMAYRLIADELHRLDPVNPILRQAQQLLGMASARVKTGNDGLDDYLTALNTVPGVGEE